MLEVTESTQFEHLPNVWRERTFYRIGYQSGVACPGSDSVYNDPLFLRVTDTWVVNSRASVTLSVTFEVQASWDHVENDVDLPQRDVSWDYVPESIQNEDRTIWYNHYYSYNGKTVPEPSGVGPSTSSTYVTPVLDSTNNLVNVNNVEDTPTVVN